MAQITMNELLEFALEQKASDIHITAGVPPKLRIHGKLVDVAVDRLTPADTKVLVESMLTPRLANILREKGEADFSYTAQDIGRYRVNAYMQKGCMAAALRRIETVIPTPDMLGLPEHVVELYKRRRGLVLVTGPTGSGKSTTLASILDRANSNLSTHILTMEDPVEYVHHHKVATINQREVGQDTLSYANALRAALREDPDIILVGEMRDFETISTAVTAAETGHLVFSTLHTIGAAATIDRIIDVFPPHQQQQIRVQLAMVMVAVVSQQLMPTADGNGRVAAFEVMIETPAIKALIREGKSHQIPSTIQTSRAQGMITMDDSIFDLYRQGAIDKETAITFSQDQASMIKRLG